MRASLESVAQQPSFGVAARSFPLSTTPAAATPLARTGWSVSSFAMQGSGAAASLCVFHETPRPSLGGARRWRTRTSSSRAPRAATSWESSTAAAAPTPPTSAPRRAESIPPPGGTGSLSGNCGKMSSARRRDGRETLFSRLRRLHGLPAVALGPQRRVPRGDLRQGRAPRDPGRDRQELGRRASRRVPRARAFRPPTFRPSPQATTATVCAVTERAIEVAWVGDSRAVLAARSGSKVAATALTADHRPEDPGEKLC